MAKRRTRRRSSSPIVRTVRAPAQVIRVSAPRAPVRHRRRRSSGGGGGGGSLSTSRLFAIGLGGMALGFIEKAVGSSLPTFPVIGRKGTIAGIAYWMTKSGHGPSILRDVAVVAAGMAGYELGATGKISGDVADQVHGVAAQV